jgi:hypothetical protein
LTLIELTKFSVSLPEFRADYNVKAANESFQNVSQFRYLRTTVINKINEDEIEFDRLCGLVVRVLGYRSGGPGSIPGTTKKKSSGSETGSTQPREYN